MANRWGKSLQVILATAVIGIAGGVIYWQVTSNPDFGFVRRPTYAPPPPPSIEVTQKQSDADEAALQKALETRDRFVLLPKNETPYCDAAGHLWFSTFSSDSRLFKHSVERAAHGVTRFVNGGKILLLDSTGRYWCKSDGLSDLLCFDGKKWLAPHAPPAPSSPQAPHSMIQPVAVEDPSGNCYFLAAQARATPMLMCFT
ncbi:MAG: hypothetical protein ACTHLN_04255, partial [Tepidisphaeraceae bacterium]